MRVDVHPADAGGCGWYRLRFPAEEAARQGVDVAFPGGVDCLNYNSPDGRRHAHKLDPDSADPPGDVVVYQRVLRRIDYETILALQAAGRAVVVDVDDDFHSLPPGHPARRSTSVRHNPDSNRMWLRKACEAADLVTVSTPALADRYAPHGRVRVLPNCVPAWYLTVTGEPFGDPLVRVGWAGSHQTHVGDLEETGGGVERGLASSGAVFHVIGTGVRVAKALGLTTAITTTDWVDFERYPHEYARLDVAIAPLAPNRFNEAKSWLKPLEAMALGVPVVVSPSADYLRLGCPQVASTPGEWAQLVGRLAADPVMRSELAEEGRALAARWTYEERWEDWADAWSCAARMRSVAA